MSSESPQKLVALANGILAREDLLDAFGHVSVRDPADPGRFFLSRSLAPEFVTKSDVLKYDLTGQPITPTESLYSERVIHAVLYRVRPNVNAICHRHAPSPSASAHTISC